MCVTFDLVYLQSGEIAKHLEFVSHGIRTKLDEIKRREIDRLRQIMRMQHKVQMGMVPGLHIPQAVLERMYMYIPAVYTLLTAARNQCGSVCVCVCMANALFCILMP